MATITHFDVPADLPERARGFYEKLFGWRIEQLPGPATYYMLETKDLDGKTGTGGGITRRESHRQAGITNFIGLASVDDAARVGVVLGDKVIQPKQAVPGWGYLALCTDTENNVFGRFQEDKAAK